MSHSFKKQPFSAVTTADSAKEDKRLAARGVRRAHRHAIQIAQDFDDFLLPHKRECAWNEVYNWSRDGNQRYVGMGSRWYFFGFYNADYLRKLMRK